MAVQPRSRTALVLPAVLLALSGCYDALADTDEVFYDWSGRRSLCGVSLDDRLDVSETDLRAGMERARDRGEVLVFYAHSIGTDGKTLAPERLERVLFMAQDLNLPFLTFPELAGPPPESGRAGVVLTFDDADVDSWYGARDLFSAYGARATFFVTRFWRLSQKRRDELHELFALGHAVENHGKNHLDAPSYAAELGAQAYVDDEVLPNAEDLRADGFSPTTFSYPYGTRTRELDHVILEHVSLVRSLSWLFASSALVNDPCPE